MGQSGYRKDLFGQNVHHDVTYSIHDIASNRRLANNSTTLPNENRCSDKYCHCIKTREYVVGEIIYSVGKIIYVVGKIV